MVCFAFHSSISFDSSNILSGEKTMCLLLPIAENLVWDGKHVNRLDKLLSEDPVNGNKIEEGRLRRLNYTIRHPVPVCG